MESFFNFRQEFIKNEPIKKRKPVIRIAVQIDENHLENNVISFKDLFRTSTYDLNKTGKKHKENLEVTESEEELKSDALSCSESEEYYEKTEFEDNVIEEDISKINSKCTNNVLNEELSKILNSKQPLDIKKAVYLRDTIAKEKIQNIEMDLLKKKKRKFYEYYDMNDPFIDDSEDYIIENTTKKIEKKEQDFIVWSGKYGNENKRKNNNKMKQTKIDNIINEKKDNKKMKKPTILYPLNPRVGDLMKRLKDQCNSCNWYKPNSIPECLLPLLKRILKIAERYNLLNENFYEHLRLSLKYQYNENIEFLKYKIEIIILEEKIQKKQDIYDMYLDELKSFIYEYENYNVYNLKKRNKENFQNNIHEVCNNSDNNKKLNNIRKNFLWTEEARMAVYHIVNLKCEIQDLKNILEEKLNPDFKKCNKNRLTKKQIYQDLASLWPKSTMNPLTISKEYSYIHRKNERLLIRSLENIPKNIRTANKNDCVIKIFDKFEEKYENPILPLFIKSSSKFYPNHDKKYQRRVIAIPKENKNPSNVINITNINNKNNSNKNKILSNKNKRTDNYGSSNSKHSNNNNNNNNNNNMKEDKSIKPIIVNKDITLNNLSGSNNSIIKNNLFENTINTNMDIDKDYINNNTKIEINDINLINKNSVQKKEHPEIVLDDTKNSSFIMNKENNIRNKINKVSRSESTGKVRLCCFKTTRNKKVSTNALNKPISSKNELANKLKDTFKENNKITSKRVEVNPISTNENENSIHNHISSEIDDNTNEKNINDEKNSNPQYIKNNNYKSKGDTITIDDDDDDDNDSNSNSNSNIARDVNVTKKVTKKGKNTMSNTILPATEKGISSKSIIKPYKPHKISKPRAFRRRKLTKNKSSDSLSNTSSPSQISNENVLLNYTSSSNSNVSSSNSKKSSVSKVNFSNGNRSLRQNSSKRKMNKNVISSIIDLTSPNKNNNYNYSLYNKDNNNTQEPNRLEYLKEKFHKLSIQNDMMKQKCSVASSNFPQHQMSTPKKHKGESKESISQSNLNDISKNIFENEKPKSVRTSPLRLSLHRKKTL